MFYSKNTRVDAAFFICNSIWYFWNLWEDVPGPSRNLTANKFADDVTGLIEKARQDYHAYGEDKQRAEESKAMIAQEIEELQDTVQQKKILQTQEGFKTEHFSSLLYLLGSLLILKPFISAI